MAQANKRPQYENLITPKGLLIYPKLSKPDTKFNADGIFSTRVRFTAEQAAPLIAKIDKLAEEHFATYKAELEAAASGDDKKAKVAAKKALGELKMATKPYKPFLDEDGDETGDFEFNFKMPAQIKMKDGTVKKLKPDLVDAKGKKLPAGTQIWGGTEACIAVQFRPFAKPATGVGVSLRLQGVQVIKLVSEGQANIGWAQQEGYEAEEDDGEDPMESKPAPAANDAEGDETEF